MSIASTRTIFLCTDGRHTAFASGDHHDLPAEALAAIKAQGLRGWLSIMDGAFYGRKAPSLSRVHAVEGATDNEWDAAVAKFQQSRSRVPS